MTKTVSILAGLMLICFAAPLALDPATRKLLAVALGLDATGIMRGHAWTFLTYQFLHGSWSHLVLNLVSLFFAGPEVERAVGPRRFLAIYFVSGMLGAAAWLAIVWPLDALLIGASASICGLLGALVALRPHEKYTVLFLPVPLPAWLLVLALAATQIAHLMLGGASAGVAYTAHLAGGLAGFFTALALRRKK